MSFPEVIEQPHFEKTSFRVAKKIFATLDEINKRAVVKLSEIDQDVFCSIDKTIIYPVSNKWGKQGWTNIELKTVRKDLLKDVLAAAYCGVAPKKLTALVNKFE
jgi:predicted DNA-binding protein (MmcQ/YjbR family)